MLAVGVGSRRIDKHADLTSRVHDVFADCLFLLQSKNDVVQTPSAVYVLVDIITFALIRDIVVVNPSSKSLIGLQEQNIKELVRIGLDQVWWIVGVENPALHCNRAAVVFGAFAARHCIVDAHDMVGAVIFDVCNGVVAFGVAVWHSVESSCSSPMVARLI